MSLEGLKRIIEKLILNPKPQTPNPKPGMSLEGLKRIIEKNEEIPYCQ